MTATGLYSAHRIDSRWSEAGHDSRHCILCADPYNLPNMKRGFDVILALVATILFAVPIALIAALISATSSGPVLYWSDRVGVNNRLFRMPKFRTMRIGTPAVASHLLVDAESHVTRIGAVLRRTSLDELPQLWSILRGDMTWVGPRPALFNQEDLIKLRTTQGVHALVPGLTGWAQINGRDEIPIPEKVRLDAEYLHRKSFWFDMKILWCTAAKATSGDGVTH
jgi:O-antigen biosynthesis protein WbqP